MTSIHLRSLVVAAICGATFAATSAHETVTVERPHFRAARLALQGGAQGRGRGGVPDATPDQLKAIADMNAALADLTSAVARARNQLATVAFAEGSDEVTLRAAVEALRSAELALALRRAELFAALQAGPARLSPEQVSALAAAGGSAPTGRGRGN